MILEHIHIINYRNLADAELSFSRNVNCFVGNNGAGKTNILDAIYYLSFCKSSAIASDAANVLHGEEFFLIQGQYEGDMQVSAAFRTGGRKVIKRADKAYRRYSEHVGLIPLIMISPGDMQLVSGGSEERRRFMDVAIAQYAPDYLAALIRYGRTLKQRNALLKQEDEPDDAMFDVLEEMMAADAAVIYRERAAFSDEFRQYFQDVYSRLGVAGESVNAAYSTHANRGPLDRVLHESRAKERIVGYTLYGPHRDDLELQFDGYALRGFGSQGQTKTYFIAMKLAQYALLRERGETGTPILLLDDIFDKLDATRVSRIVDYVGGEAMGQIFITDTSSSHLDSILRRTTHEYKLFKVENGKAAEQGNR